MATTDWPAFLRQPLAQSLALSLGIHLALLALVQPITNEGLPQTLVINARLEAEAVPETPPAPSTPQPPATPPPEEVPSPPPPAPPVMGVPKPAPIQVPEAPPAPQAPMAPSPQSVATVETREAPAAPPRAVPATPTTPAAQPAAENGGPPILSVPIDTNWYLARQVDRHPKAIGSITPKYPETARQRGQEGTLKLMVKIDELGRVRDVAVVEATPRGVFDEAALEAFSDARFQPAMKNGRPVRYEAYMRVEFKLE